MGSVIMLKLNQIDINKKAQILNINLTENFKRRILDIGIIPGLYIYKIMESPFKKISAYDINDTLIAIRDTEASNIEVKYV